MFGHVNFKVSVRCPNGNEPKSLSSREGADGEKPLADGPQGSESW